MNDVSRANREWKDEAARRRERTEQSRNLPSRFQGSTSDVRYLYVIGGNTLDTDQDGVKYSATEVTELDEDYDPTVDDAFQDGIGKGWLYTNGTEADDPVLFVNDPRSLIGDAVLGENDDTDGPDRLMVIGQVTIPIAGGGSKTVLLVA